MRILKYGLLAILGLLLAFIVAGCSREPMAARVNGQGIAMKLVDDQIKQLKQQNSAEFKGEEGKKLEKKFRGQIVDFLIELELVGQEAAKQKVSVSDKDVDRRLDEMMKSANLTTDKQLEDMLKQQGMTLQEFKQRLKQRMVWTKMYEKVTKGVKVSDAEVARYYSKNRSRYDTPATADTKQILLSDKALADQVLAKIKAGGSFEALAKQYSIDTSTKDKGGDLPPLPKNQVVPEFANVVFALKPGQVSPVFKTVYGYHIVKMEKHIPGQR